MVALPLVVRTVVPVLRSVDDRQRQAAASLGAGPWRVLLTVDLPVAWRSLLAAAGFAFAVSLGEFGATSFLAREDRPTLPVVIYRLVAPPGRRELRHGDGRLRAAGGDDHRGHARRCSACASASWGRCERAEGPAGSRCRASASGSVARWPSTASTSRCRPARCSRSSGRRAAASRRCCARSPGWSGPRRARRPTTAATSPATPVHRRGFALMFQDGQLFPHLDVAANVAYPLRLRHVAATDARARVARAARARRARGVRRPRGRPRSPAASVNGSRWPGRWPSSRGCCCSTSR